jgi:hypothetical protein
MFDGTADIWLGDISPLIFIRSENTKTHQKGYAFQKNCLLTKIIHQVQT